MELIRCVRRPQLAGAVLMGALAASAVWSCQAWADDPTIGFITTLSTPAGYIGEDIRDGFQLAITEEGGKLGGVAVKLVIETML
jgi:branched-chain amino acid transport system substrate-binding protein